MVCREWMDDKQKIFRTKSALKKTGIRRFFNKLTLMGKTCKNKYSIYSEVGIEMRKFVFSVSFLFVFFSYNSFAIGDQNTNCEIVDGVCPAGCNYEEGGLFQEDECSPCPVGYYNSEQNSACVKCFPKVDDAFIDDGGGTYTGYTTDSCPWTITCEAGQYWDGGETKCKSCGTFYTSNGATVEGAGSEVVPSEDVGTCYGKTFTLKLNKNTRLETIGNDVYADKDVQYEYLKGIKGKPLGDGGGGWEIVPIYDYIPVGQRHSNTVLKTFNGYASDNARCNSDTTKIFDKDGKFLPLDAVGDAKFSRLNDLLPRDGDVSEEVQLYACWENNVILISYSNGTESMGKKECMVQGVGNNDSFSCTVDRTPEKPGMVFMGYKCTYNNGKLCFPDEVDKLLKRGDEIPPVASEIYLTAQFKECFAGYYCDSNGEHSCPEGTTSTRGAAKAKSDCYMVRGNAGTKFCSKDRCFTLPGYGNILYEPQF